MRIPENAISTKQKKRRSNLLDKIPGGFFIVLLLLAIWGGGALLGVWIEDIYPKDKLSASAAEPSESEPQLSAQQPVKVYETLSDIVNFEEGSATPIYEAERLKAYVLGLNPQAVYQISVCSSEQGDGDGIFTSESFAHGAKLAAVFKSIEPRLTLQVKSQADCTDGFEVKSISLKDDARALAMRIESSANAMSSGEQVFFEQAFNRLLVDDHRLLLIGYGDDDLKGKLAQRLINQGFKPEQLELVLGSQSHMGESAKYLMAYVVPKAHTTNN